MPEGNPIPIIIECLLLQFIVCTNRSPYVGRLFTIGSTHNLEEVGSSSAYPRQSPRFAEGKRGGALTDPEPLWWGSR